MATLTEAWRDAYTDAELAEWIDPPPCICGHDRDRHQTVTEHRNPNHQACGSSSCPHDMDEFETCLDCYEPDDPDCCWGWIPDRERLCERCHGGLALTEHQTCDHCADRGWVE